MQCPLQKTPPNPEEDTSREDVTQQQKGAGAEFHLLFAAGLPSEQDQALAQLIVLGGRGQVWVFSLEKNEPLIPRK